MRPLLAFPILMLVACGGSDSQALTSEGYAALGKGDARLALTRFDSALADMTTDSPDYLRASIGRCRALARTDGPAATQSFLQLAQRVPAQISEDDYSLICSEQLRGEFRMDAMDVMKAGEARFPDSAKMKATVAAVIAATERAALPEELQKLATLGYAGGGK